MEFREIIVWFGLVAILIILWDGFRRMKSKPRKPKVKVEPEDDWEDPEEAARKAQIARELPNGGARIREMTEEEKQKVSSKFNLNLRERVPMLMERVVVEGEETDAERLEKESDNTSKKDDEAEAVVQSEMDFTSAPEQPEVAPAPEAEPISEVKSDPTVYEEKVHIEPTFGALDDEPESSKEDVPFSSDFSGSDYEDEKQTDDIPESNEQEQENSADTDDEYASEVVDAKQSSDEEEFESSPKEKEPAKLAEDPLPVEDLIVVHLMAKEGGEINGRALLELLVHAGLRHGPMDIFHYRNPQGKTEFSLANCVRPGTFNPDAMADVNTPGVTLFLQLPCTADAMESFEHMIEMARFMAANLNTNLLDEEHSTVTPQVVEYYREKLRAFARKQLIPS
ncbi:cell division protein ZipA [Reinekea sp.]|jgi:cell division protein ZipA|uniref:cell division protein ZipA n=1 Tax=Reinekea sp. TaxID=1970455 RepID=UPI003988B458